MVAIRAVLEPQLSRAGVHGEVPWERLEWLAGQWIRFGRVMNLTGARDEEGLAEQVLESLQVVALARKLGCASGQRWIDVGSGAGFPGLIVAACLPVEMVLVEPRERRAGFLELMLAQLGGGSVVRGRLEREGWQGARELEGRRFEWVSARAVFAPERWVEVARGIVAPGGIVVAHLHRGDADPEGVEPAGIVEGDRWSVRGYRL
jgi:16S rRNA (guanine527-N7)-methyltransferase